MRVTVSRIQSDVPALEMEPPYLYCGSCPSYAISISNIYGWGLLIYGIERFGVTRKQIGIVGFHLIEQKRAFSLRFLLSSSADSATPAVISEIEPSGGCSV